MRLALDDTWPATSSNGPSPIATPPICTRLTEAYPATVVSPGVPAGELVLVARVDEPGKERMGRQRLRLELRVELHRDVPRVRRQLDNLDELAVRERPTISSPASVSVRSYRQLNS